MQKCPNNVPKTFFQGGERASDGVHDGGEAQDGAEAVQLTHADVLWGGHWRDHAGGNTQVGRLHSYISKSIWSLSLWSTTSKRQTTFEAPFTLYQVCDHGIPINIFFNLQRCENEVPPQICLTYMIISMINLCYWNHSIDILFFNMLW